MTAKPPAAAVLSTTESAAQTGTHEVGRRRLQGSGANMRIELTENGPVVPAGDLGPLLGIEPTELPRLMREGEVAAAHEIGVGEDARRFRLRFRFGGRMVRLTCTDDGAVISTIRTDTGLSR